MKPIFLNLSLLLALTHFASAQNQLTKTEQQQGWKMLFNGKNTDGWHSYLKPKTEAAWMVKDGALTLDPKAEGQGDLLTNKEYENFELAVEWKISAEGNSGIIFGVHEDPVFNATYDTGIEMQVLDNKGAEDNKKANHLAGSLYDMKAPSADVAKPAGEWNMVKIRKEKGHLTFWMNGTKTIETQMGSPEWESFINNSKFKTWKNFAKYPKGHLALQDHGHEVAFRNIMIKEL
ncbi:MAG: 3-keto-disaccharide hydrolase [Janthinobacterium lividum]